MYELSGIPSIIYGKPELATVGYTEQALQQENIEYKDKIAVSVDVKDGYVAIKGWVEKSNILLYDFLKISQLP